MASEYNHRLRDIEVSNKYTGFVVRFRIAL